MTHLEYRNELLALLMLALGGWLLISLKAPVPLGVRALGVISGSTIALHAMAMVLVYRSNRFINFAQVQIGAVGATLFTVLVNARPIPRWINNVCPPCADPNDLGALGRNVNYTFALVVAFVVSIGLAWVVHATVVRRFAKAPRLIVAVASVFLAQFLAALAAVVSTYLLTEQQKETPEIFTRSAPFPFTFDFRIGSVVFSVVDLFLVAATALAVVAIPLYLRRSATGNSITAAADDPARAATLGINVAGVTGRVWLLVGLLSGIAALVPAMSPSAGGGGSSGEVSVDAVVPVLAAMVLARMSSLPVAAAAAVVVGMLEQSMAHAFGAAELLDGLFVVIICALLLAQRFRSGRSDVDSSGGWRAVREMRPVPAELRDLPSVRKWVRLAAGITAVVVLGYPWIGSPTQTIQGAVYLIFGIVGMSLLVLTGWAGQISLGQFALAAVGAWAAMSSGLPFAPALLLGAVAGAAAAVLVGIPALKLRGLHLAITTLSFAVAVPAVVLNPEYLGRWIPDRIERPSFVGLDLDDARAFYYFCGFALVLVVLAVRTMRRSRTGRALIAARDNEAAAQAFGVDLVRARLGAFAVSGAFAAVAGVLYALSQRSVGADVFAAEQSLTMFVFTVVGGLGSLAGPLLGIAYYYVVNTFGGSPLIAALSTGGGLLLLLLVPGGLASLYASVRDSMLRRIASRYRIVVPSLVSEARLTSEVDLVPLIPKLRPGGGSAFVPRRYVLPRQWLADGEAEAPVRDEMARADG